MVANTCAADWEVVASRNGREVNAKSIMGIMMLGACYGSEVEFFSLMPDHEWAQFTASLEALFYLVDHQGSKVNAYTPVETVLRVARDNGDSCLGVQSAFRSRSAKYNCGPFFERLDSGAAANTDAAGPITVAPLDFSFQDVDSFISYDSKDFSYAIRIYDALLDRGFNVFLAGASLPKSGTTDFQLGIERALARTRSMILVASDPAHLEGGWVRAEWTTFLNEKRTGRKAGNLVTIRPPQIPIEALPVMLRMYQSEEISDRGPLSAERIERLIDFLAIANKT